MPIQTKLAKSGEKKVVKARRSNIAGRLNRAARDVSTGAARQFCTTPCPVFLRQTSEADGFISDFRSQISNTEPAPLLTGGIQLAFESASDERKGEVDGFTENSSTELNGFDVKPSVFETSARDFLSRPDLSDEIFGPTTLLVNADSKEDLMAIARSLEGQLTASVHGDEDDLIEYADLTAILEPTVGRLIINAFSTGVEVCPSMVHGGPYPATSDSRSTAVGSRAIARFARLVCFQNFPDATLPDELKEENPVGIWRMVDGMFEK